MQQLMIALLLVCALPVTATTLVVYPKSESATDHRFDDLKEILTVALEKTTDDYGPYELKESVAPMNEARYISELLEGRSVNLIWSSTSASKEASARPIRIPLRKGILGYRIALIHKDAQARIDQVQTLDDLRQLSVAQGIGWGDVAIYEANGIRVSTTGYDSLFRLINGHRVDLFPRGIGEVFTEFDERSPTHPNMAVEQNLLIYYPWPYYFFTNKNDTELAERIETGLRRMIADGEMDALFEKYNNAAIQRADMANRRIIEIRNHLLPEATPLDDESLWFDPLD